MSQFGYFRCSLPDFARRSVFHMLCTAYKGHVHHTLLLMYELASTGLGMASRVVLHLDLLYTLPTPIEGVLLFSCGFLTCCTPAPFDAPISKMVYS